jgi:hypothetical protein
VTGKVVRLLGRNPMIVIIVAAISFQLWGSGLQAEFFSQQFQRSLRQLFGVLPKLPIEAGIVVCAHAAFESSGVSGAIKETRRDR